MERKCTFHKSSIHISIESVVKDYYDACQNKASLSMKKFSKLEKTADIVKLQYNEV